MMQQIYKITPYRRKSIENEILDTFLITKKRLDDRTMHYATA